MSTNPHYPWCGFCRGTGMAPFTYNVCPICKGSRRDNSPESKTCPDCNGWGRTGEHVCGRCYGSGRIREL
jgi:DnaJ-class molecular chaperone